MKTWADIKHFKPSEFDSPDQKDSGYLMDLDLIEVLDAIREMVGTPLTITSGYRTIQHNAAVGGKANSAHVYGKAADILCESSSVRFKIIKAAMLTGICRFEDGAKHVHIDVDATLPQEVFVYTKEA